MTLQGSIHKRSDGIGYGAFIPTNAAYYNLRTPKKTRPTSNMIRQYRRYNDTAGIDTHRSDISFGRTEDNIKWGALGDPRAIVSTQSLTSGEVGNFCWAEAKHGQGYETSTLSSSALTSFSSNPTSSNDPGSEGPILAKEVPSARSLTGSSATPPDRSLSPLHSSRSLSCTISTSKRSSQTRASQDSGRWSRSSSTDRSISSSMEDSIQGQPQKYRVANSTARSSQILPQFQRLDNSFEKHHKYDIRASTSIGPITGRYGPIDSASIISNSQLTAELSTPWSHILRGRKY
ncbi:unnamed protein product [Choristocarpus tenellus]